MLIGICVLMSYQNCAQAPDADSSASSSSSSYQNGLPFAYVEKVDTISYMSCSEIKNPVDPRAYYSFRVGAYNASTGGLGMTTAFRSATQYYSTQDRAKVLSVSDVNANTRLNLSMRLRSNMQSLWAQGELRAGDEIDSFLPPLDSADVAGPFAGLMPGQMRNYFPGTNSKRLMEASLRFYEFENVAKDTRSNLEGSGNPTYLVVGYSNSADELDAMLRTPDSTLPQRAYGTGFGMSFALPNGYSSGERRVISPFSGVQEIDLQTGQQRGSSWDCNANYQFMVIRPEDKAANRVICNTTVDRYVDANQQAALTAIRRVLRVEDWYVDLDNHCVVPKRTGDYCYGALNGRTVQYGVANCTNAGSTMCPHFVSVCIRR